MRCLVVGAAPVATRHDYYHHLIRTHTGTVLAVDGGCDLCHAAGRPPEFVVGDLDSGSEAALAYARASGAVMRLAPADKDVTDLDIALDVAAELGAVTAVVTATWTARLDHTLAAVGSVIRATGVNVEIADPDLAGWVLDSATRPAASLSGPGAQFSIMALASDVVISCEGARYPLDHACLDPLSSRGVSNVIGEGPAIVRVDHGRALVITCAAAGVPLAEISEPARGRRGIY